MNKQQKNQAKNLQTAKRQLQKERADLKSTINLTPSAKLGAAEKRRLVASVQKAKRDGKIPRTAQQTIPYREMCRDGICAVTERYFTKQIQFYDINYQLAQNEDKNLIFENYCDFLNYFDSSIRVQLSFLNQRTDMEEYQRCVQIPDQMDAFNSIREEYSDMLKGQLAKGNNGLTKTKYITFGVEADSLKAAKPRLERIEADILANFKVLGVRAHSLNGYERLANAVRYVSVNGLMGGYGDGRFGPNDYLSRAQLAQILHNREGKPGVNYLLQFNDVANGTWYSEAIRWATSRGIVGGYGDGHFGPNDNITREQLAVMLWRYAGSPAATDRELHFADAYRASDWALEALRWATEHGIINGKGNGTLDPGGQATRAEAAQMLMNFLQK